MQYKPFAVPPLPLLDHASSICGSFLHDMAPHAWVILLRFLYLEFTWHVSTMFYTAIHFATQFLRFRNGQLGM